MAQKTVISTFLLCLLFLVNWHNTFFHTHSPAPQHDHHHASEHHHHQHGLAHFLDWITQLLGDFEHSDLGNNHLELFLNPNHQTGFDYVNKVEFQPLPLFLQSSDLHQNTIIRHRSKNFRELTFPDSSFFDLPDNRGPPLFS